MNSTLDPVFTNTCGKIFRDRILLATSQRELSFKPQQIKSIRIRRSLALKDLAFAAVSASFLVVPLFLKKEDTLPRVLFGIIGLTGLVMSLLKSKKSYSLVLKTTEGKKHQLTIWEGNVKETEKFIAQARAIVEKHKAGKTPGYEIDKSITEGVMQEAV